MGKRQFFHSYKIALIILSLIISTQVYSQTIVFEDDFESGTNNWNLTGTFDLTSNEYYSSVNSLTESPSGNYTNMQTMYATLNNALDLSNYLSSEISFYAKYSIEAAFDFMYLEISKDGGSTYSIIDEFSGEAPNWAKYTYNMGSFAGNSNVIVRFRFTSDHYVGDDGMYIDDVVITGYTTDDASPLIVHEDPKFYEGSSNDFEVKAFISDVSGISSTKLFYFTDGNGPYEVSGSNIGGNEYKFVIPAQEVGANVSYIIQAADNANPINSTDTSLAPIYKYIAGEYFSYDDGIVDAVYSVSGENAVAVKISVPDGKYGFLKSALIRNYRDANHTNDEMLFHVWDNNGGVPGDDLITPFLVNSEATLDNPFPFTRIDLRGFSYELEDLTGDLFIGFTVPENSVHLIVSNNSSSRSFSYNGSTWSSYNKDFEFRAIMDISSSPLPVELTTFDVEVNDKNVLLLWETATEINNYGFEVERQIQGSSSNYNDESSEWKKIGFVSGSGNSNSPKYYLFEDNSNNISGTYFYRLKQIDIDGKFEYSEIVEVIISAPKEFTLEQNYPNPFNPTTTIKYSIPNLDSEVNSSSVKLIVYDILGKEIATLVNEKQSAGSYEVNFDARDYPSGLYLYTISIGDLKKSKKMLLVK